MWLCLSFLFLGIHEIPDAAHIVNLWFYFQDHLPVAVVGGGWVQRSGFCSSKPPASRAGVPAWHACPGDGGSGAGGQAAWKLGLPGAEREALARQGSGAGGARRAERSRPAGGALALRRAGGSAAAPAAWPSSGGGGDEPPGIPTARGAGGGPVRGQPGTRGYQLSIAQNKCARWKATGICGPSQQMPPTDLYWLPRLVPWQWWRQMARC